MDNGNYYISPQLLKRKIKGVYFNSKWSKSDKDLKTYFGLELADLCSYQYINIGDTGKRIFRFSVLKKKYIIILITMDMV
jgi:hypothetical protein